MAGLALAPIPPYLGDMAMPPLVRPSAAFADLRAFLASRERYHWVFALLSVLITGYFITVFLIQSRTKDYKPPEVVWVQNYSGKRTDAQIKAQQLIDQKKQKEEANALKELQEAQRKSSEALSKKLSGMGF